MLLISWNRFSIFPVFCFDESVCISIPYREFQLRSSTNRLFHEAFLQLHDFVLFWCCCCCCWWWWWWWWRWWCFCSRCFVLFFVLWFLLIKSRLSLFHACVKNALKVIVACVVGWQWKSGTQNTQSRGLLRAMSSAMISWVFRQTAKFRNGAQCCPVYHPTSKITRDDRIGKCLSN